VISTQRRISRRRSSAHRGKGVDVVYDSVANDFRSELELPASAWIVALFGASSGPVPPFDLTQLNGKGSLFVTGLRFGTTSPRGRARVRPRCAGWASKGELKLRTEFVYDLADVAQAQTTWKAEDDGQDPAGAVKTVVSDQLSAISLLPRPGLVLVSQCRHAQYRADR